MSYHERLKGHLANYKLTRLGISEPGMFKHRGRELPYHHILPLQHRNLNLLEPVRRDILDHVQTNGLQLHRYFHHLNSSQAFAFNLFFPYFCGVPDGARCLLRAFGQKAHLMDWEPEAVPHEAEGSNIDVRWRTSDGTTTFCEVKLSESGVGTASNDDRHRCKLEKIYAPVLAPYFDPAQLESAVFCRSYQYYRNVWHMVRTPGARLVFLLPRSNGVLWRQLQNLLNATSHEIGGHISTIAIEDMLASLISDRLASEGLRQYAIALGEKYVIRNADATQRDPCPSA